MVGDDSFNTTKHQLSGAHNVVGAVIVTLGNGVNGLVLHVAKVSSQAWN